MCNGDYVKEFHQVLLNIVREPYFVLYFFGLLK